MNKSIDSNVLNLFEEKRDKTKTRTLISNALRANGIDSVSMNKSAFDEMNFTFSHELPFTKITNQEKSGRCWLFAALNTIRQKFIKRT